MPSAIFFFNDTATTEIYTLSLHDALPIFADSKTADDATAVGAGGSVSAADPVGGTHTWWVSRAEAKALDRKSTRLNSSHLVISYAVFCLKKKISFAWLICSR